MHVCMFVCKTTYVFVIFYALNIRTNYIHWYNILNQSNLHWVNTASVINSLFCMYSVTAQSTDTGGDRQGHVQLSTSGMYKCLSKTHNY